MMRISWGNKIILMYVGFVIMILSMVIMSMREKVDMVTSDYYEKELHFQRQIEAAAHFRASGAGVSIVQSHGELLLKFQGEVWPKAGSMVLQFYRPSDQSLDFEVPFSAGPYAQQRIVHPTLTKGLYKVKAAWTFQGREYFFEESFFYP